MMMMAMTQAKTGRSRKNFDNIRTPPSSFDSVVSSLRGCIFMAVPLFFFTFQKGPL